MKIYKSILVVFLALAFFGCSTAPKEELPTDILKKFVEASQKKDGAAIRQTLSSGTLKMIEESAKAQGLTLEESLNKDGGTTLKDVPETRNEQITGDTATVEIKNNAVAEWDRFPFVKEEGKWKLALDKYVHDLEEKYKRQTSVPNTPNTNSKGTTQNNSSSNSKP